MGSTPRSNIQVLIYHLFTVTQVKIIVKA